MRGQVVAVCAGEIRGAGKADIRRGYLEKEHGLVGDAHAGPGDRQVSLVAMEDVAAVAQTRGVEGRPGDFAANIATSDVDLVALPVSSRLRVGEAVLEVTHIGKSDVGPHHFSFRGVALLVDRGVFCRVLHGGWVQEGDLVLLEADR